LLGAAAASARIENRTRGSGKGEKIAWHSHPPYMADALTPGKMHFTMPDKSTKDFNRAIVVELKKAKPIGAPVQAGKKKTRLAPGAGFVFRFVFHGGARFMHPVAR
jgi:hypothetical protein